jgi:hypothetical protein
MQDVGARVRVSGKPVRTEQRRDLFPREDDLLHGANPHT